MRIVLLLIAFLFFAFSAQSQVLKSAGVWYFLDVDSMTARPAVLPNGTELAYVVGTKTVYYWNRATSTWAAYGSTFNRDSIYFDASIIGSGTVSDPWGVDSTLFATISAVGDSIAAAVANYFPLEGGTLTGTGGAGFLGLPAQSGTPSTPSSGFKLFANGAHNLAILDRNGWITTFDISATANRDFTYPSTGGTFALGTGTADRSARWSATNILAAGNMTDNGTKLQALLPWQFQTYTTAGLPTGVDGYVVKNTTTGFTQGYFTSQWENYITSIGAANGQLSIFSSAGKTYGTNSLFWDNSNTRLGIGTATPSQDVHLRKGVAGAVQFSVENTTSGTTAFAGYRLINNTAAVGAIFKLSSTYSTYKNQAANDFGIINTTNGNMAFLNDVATGNISFQTGNTGSVNAMTMEPDGDIHIPFKLGIGLTPVQKVDIRQDQNASTRVNISNQSTGNAAWAGASFGNSTGGTSFYKLGSGYTTYKTQTANDAGFINTVSGNISILNDWASGKIILTGGGSSTQHFSVEANGRVIIGNVTPQRLLHVEGEARISDLTTDTPTRIVGADADGDLGALTLGDNVSISSGVLNSKWLKTELPLASVRIGALSHSLTLDSLIGFRVTSPNHTSEFGNGNINQGKKLTASGSKYYDTYYQYDSRTSISNGTAVGAGPSYSRAFVYNRGSGEEYEWTDMHTLDSVNGVFGHRYGAQYKPGFVSFRALRPSGSAYRLTPNFSMRVEPGGNGVAGSPVLSVFTSSDSLFSVKLNGTLEADLYGLGNKTAAAISKTGTNLNATYATDGTLLEIERKRDTTIYIDDADYDFSAALTTAQVSARYNRVIFLMTTTAAAGSDSELTLHTPDINLMQCEYLVRSTDEAGGFANVIRFGTNNAVDSTNGLVSSYFPSAGQGVGIRAGLRSSVYKYRYY